MTHLATALARARVNHGRWIADCPRKHCPNAMRLTLGQTMFHCGGEGGCLLAAGVEWPRNVDEIWNALAARPVPATRNWYPRDHVEAVKLGLAHGQTPDELWEENRAHEEEVI